MMPDPTPHRITTVEKADRAVRLLTSIINGDYDDDGPYHCVKCFEAIDPADEARMFIDHDTGVVICPTCLDAERSTPDGGDRWQVVVGGHRCWKDGTTLNVVGRNVDEAAAEAAKVVRAKGHQAVAFRLTVIDDRTVEGQPLGHEFEVKAHNGGSSVVATLKAMRTFVLEPDPTPEPKRDPNLAETTVNPAVEDNGDAP